MDRKVENLVLFLIKETWKSAYTHSALHERHLIAYQIYTSTEYYVQNNES